MRLSRPLIGLTGIALAAVTLSVPGASAAAPEASSTTGPAAAGNGDRGTLHSHGPDGLDLDRSRQPDDAPPAPVVAQPVDDQLAGEWSTANPLPVVNRDQADKLSGLPSVHLVYLYPSDLKAPRTGFLNMFEADARAAQSFLLAKYGRSIRFDETADGRLDITTVRSAYRTRQLGGSTQFDLVKRDLGRVFADSESPRKKYLAWLDAPSRYCGQGELYGDWHRDAGNWNDLRTTGVVYRPYSARDASGGFCRGRTLLHELGHNLGALYNEAPNAFDGAHCDDDKNDVMCYTGNATFDSSSIASTGEFDYRNDDYWDAGATVGSTNADSGAHLNWWTVNLSRFVCRPDCADAATAFPTVDEYRYHSGAESSPPPPTRPTG